MTILLTNSVSEPTNAVCRAAVAFRQDMQSRLMRLLPVLFLALFSLTLLQNSLHLTWSLLAQVAACVVMVTTYIFRRRLSIPKSAVSIVACLYLWGMSAVSVLGLLPSSALGTALALVVMQIVLGCKHRYAGALASIASYISVGALAYVYLVDAGRTWAWSSQSATSVLPWILLSVSFACFAFIVLVEAEKMLQQILMAQTMDRTAATGDEFRAMPMLSDSDSSTAGGADANDIECDNRRLRGVNRNLEMIAYALSHDLRAPLRAIEGFTRTLAEDLGETIPEPAKRDMHEIRAGVDRMQRMVTQWLSFIRGDQSGVHREHIDLSDLAREIAAELRGNHLERKTAFQIEPGLTAFGDVQLIRELLQNLMGNAWKFTAANDLNAVIEVGAVGNDFHMNYFVRDNGAGFAAADALRLFTPFVRLHSSRQYEGTGIGLAIARKIIDAHGGRIWAEGQPDYGATFSFTLPKSAANASLAATLGTSNHCAAHDLRCAQ